MNRFGNSENELSDFFSMLPESLTHQILSFLPFKDIVRTLVLSKMWSRIWFNYPNVDLFLHEKSYMDTRHRLSFIDHIKSVMDQCILRKACIQKLQIKVSGNLEELAHIMDQCLRAAIERNVSELVIEMNFRPTTYYNIPKEVFVSNSLKVLELHGCKFEDSFSCTNLPHLQKLRTVGCLFAGENVLSEIICGCPKLEYLQALVSEGMRSFISVSCKPRLKYFHIGCRHKLKRIEIFVPSLETLKCYFAYSCSIDLASCTLLKHLEINQAILSSDYVPIQYLLSNLLQIEELHLSNCKSADKIQISSSCLKRLVITNLHKSFPGAELDIPNLLSLDFISMGECNTNNRFSSWNVPKVEEVHMMFSVKSFQSACRGGLKGFLMQLQNYEDVKLIIQCRGEQDLIMHEKLHAVSFSCLIKFLKKAKPEFLLISSRRDDSFLAHMLVSGNGNVSLSIIFSSRRSIELLHKKLSNASLLKCWYRELQLVSIEEMEHDVDSDVKLFMKTHSTGYHTARINLIRRVGWT